MQHPPKVSPTPPLITVILSTYNRHQYLREAIDSILHQTFKDFELIIVDDASSNPEVLKIIKQYEAEYSNVRVIRHTKNTGLAGSRNTGIENARGTYIMLMDDDDISLPNRALVQYDFLESHSDYAAAACAFCFIDTEGKRRYGPSQVTSLQTCDRRGSDEFPDPFILGPYTMFRRDALVDIGGYRQWFRVAEDLDLSLFLAEKYKIGRIPSIALYRHRAHQGDKLSFSPLCWYYDLAAHISAWCRRKGLRDPIDRAPELTDVLAMLPSLDMPEGFRLSRLQYARGFCHRALMARDYAALCELLRVCHRYCVRKTDQHARAYLRKLCFGIFLRVFKYRSFGWLKYHFFACR